MLRRKSPKHPPAKATEDRRNFWQSGRPTLPWPCLRLKRPYKGVAFTQVQPRPEGSQLHHSTAQSTRGDPQTIIHRLDTEPDVTIRRALVSFSANLPTRDFRRLSDNPDREAAGRLREPSPIRDCTVRRSGCCGNGGKANAWKPWSKNSTVTRSSCRPASRQQAAVVR